MQFSAKEIQQRTHKRSNQVVHVSKSLRVAGNVIPQALEQNN